MTKSEEILERWRIEATNQYLKDQFAYKYVSQLLKGA